MRAGLVLLVLVWPALTTAAHLPWMAPYRDAQGIACCSDSDCRVAQVLVQRADRGEVRVEGVALTLPPGSLHRLPPEAQTTVGMDEGYWCWRDSPHTLTAANTRCVFFQSPLW